MLLNLSNHPSHAWGSTQSNIALAQYTTIVDEPFPNIDPNCTVQELNNLAEKYLQKIITIKPMAVHIMGEMTFVFRLVSLLKSANINCIASTTKRIAVEENGIKTSKFEFVQFRPY